MRCRVSMPVATKPIRITEVLSYFKESWYIDWVCRIGKREANRISKASMKVGTETDRIIKLSLDPNNEGVPVKVTPEVKNCWQAYQKWKTTYEPKIITAGTRLYATIEGHEVTGEPDLYVDDVLVDIKCSSKISPSYWIQVMVYLFLKFLKNHSVDFAHGEASNYKVAILRLDKQTASYEYVVKDYDKTLVDCWVGLMRAFVYFKGEDNGRLDIQEVGENKEVA